MTTRIPNGSETLNINSANQNPPVQKKEMPSSMNAMPPLHFLAFPSIFTPQNSSDSHLNPGGAPPPNHSPHPP